MKQQYIHIELLNKRKKQLISYLLGHEEEGVTVSNFRDLINSNRNTTVFYLEHFDSEGITMRKGNDRFLTAKFKKSLA